MQAKGTLHNAFLSFNGLAHLPNFLRRGFLLLILMASGLAVERVGATVCILPDVYNASTNPFSTNCPPTPPAIDTIILTGTLILDQDYDTGFNGTLIVDGGIIIWNGNFSLILGADAKLLFINGGTLFSDNCNAVQEIQFGPDPMDSYSCSGGGNQGFSFEDVVEAGCITRLGLCCNVSILVQETSGNDNDRVLCSPGDQATLTALLGGTLNGPSFSYTWNPPFSGPGPHIVNPPVTSAYAVTVSGLISISNNQNNGTQLLQCSASVTLTVNTPIGGTTTTTNVQCANSATGAVDLTPSGGIPMYTYLWSNGATSQDLSNVTAGTYTVTITDSKGCTGTTSATVTASDGIPPTVSCPMNVTINADAGLCSAIVNNIDAINPADNCGAPVLTYALTGATITSGNGNASGLAYNVGTTTVTYTVTDGNTPVTCTFTVIVNDNQLPTINCPDPITVDCIADVPDCPIDFAAFDALPGASASDNCDNNLSYSCSTAALMGGACGGAIQRTFTVVDGYTNSASCNQVITVDDNTNPVITCIDPASPIDCPAMPSFTAATATDACDAMVAITFTDATTPGGCAGAYNTTRTWTADG